MSNVRAKLNPVLSIRLSDALCSSAAFLSLKCDPLLRLQHFKFQLLPNRALSARPQDRYPLVPLIINWLKRCAPNVSRLTISCYGDVAFGGPRSEQLISVDKEFAPLSSGLTALQRVEWTSFVWASGQSHAAEQVRLAGPFLSILQLKVAQAELAL